MFNDKFEYYDGYAKCNKIVWVEKENAKCYKVYKKTKDKSDTHLVHASSIPCCLEWKAGADNPIVYYAHTGKLPVFTTSPSVVSDDLDIDFGFDDIAL